MLDPGLAIVGGLGKQVGHAKVDYFRGEGQGRASGEPIIRSMHDIRM